MGERTVRIDDALYERIRARQREEETFSETVERLIDDVSLLELAGTLSEAEAREAKAAIRASETADRESRPELGRPSEE